jgi:glutaredoxin 3
MSLILYVKGWCPWCSLATDCLDSLGLEYTVHDVEQDPAAADHMRSISGQTRVPTLEVGGAVLSDFGPEEVKPFLVAQGILPNPSGSGK